MKVYLPSHLANYFIWKANGKNGCKDLTVMKLIKLTYFAYAWVLALYDRKIFSERIEAWQHGPVIPSLYHEFKRFGQNPITSFSIYSDNPEQNKLEYPMIDEEDEDLFKILLVVWENYKDRDAIELSKITHENGSPWHNVYACGENKPLDDNLIKERAWIAINRYLREA